MPVGHLLLYTARSLTPGPAVMARRCVLPKPQAFLLSVAGMASLVQRTRVAVLKPVLD